jgi:hypothetical protein
LSTLAASANALLEPRDQASLQYASPHALIEQKASCATSKVALCVTRGWKMHYDCVERDERGREMREKERE